MNSAWTSPPVARDLQSHSTWVFGELEDSMHGPSAAWIQRGCSQILRCRSSGRPLALRPFNGLESVASAQFETSREQEPGRSAEEAPTADGPCLATWPVPVTQTGLRGPLDTDQVGKPARTGEGRAAEWAERLCNGGGGHASLLILQAGRGVPYGRELLPPGGEGQRLGRSFRFCVLLDLDSRPKGHLVHFTVDLRSPNAGPGTAMDAPPHGFCCPELIPSRARDASVSVGTAVDLRGGQTFLSPSAVQPLGSRYPLCVALFHVALQVSDVQLWSRALDARPLWIAWILAIGEAEVFRHLSFDVRYRLLCAAAVMPVCRESDVPRRIECVLDQDACSIGFQPEILSQGPQQQSRCSQANGGPRKPDTEDVREQAPCPGRPWLAVGIKSRLLPSGRPPAFPPVVQSPSPLLLAVPANPAPI
ncbi:hypothetical protein R6Z07_009572 [Ovis aries]